MALYAFDGTWNEAKTTEDPRYENTNVVRFYNAYSQRTPPGSNFYVAGVGTRYDTLGRVLGGAFGLGELSRIKEGFDHLCRRWAAGDTTIDVVGFSRGAATTLDFCHYLQERGIRHPETGEMLDADPQIRFLGVWDTVAAFGLGNLGNEVLNFGHHLTLPQKNLKYCFHALALDERRLSFLPTRLPGACEVWFRGVHSDIGGGNGNRGLNDITLRWMFRKAQASGLPIEDADVAVLAPQVVEPKPAKDLPVCVRAIASTDRRHYTVAPAAEWTNPPATCPVEDEPAEKHASEIGESGIELLPVEVRRRMAAMWEAADTVARDRGFDLEHVRAWLLNLIEGRVILVTTDAQLTLARANMGRLIAVATDNARRRDFRVLTDFFLNEALFSLPHLYPLTD
ncbi:MAG: DUF2235 domain-containing protein [Acidobacteria bacterium]|nr:DUF2235 domain-containing protein [Acidobacteriota bacterium]